MFALNSLSPPKTKPYRVFLVEDCRLVRVGIRSILDELPDFDVVGEVESGEAALQVIHSLKPDILLIDLGLPGLSGIETLKELKALQQALPLGQRFDFKVVILTSHETQEELLASLAAGAHAYCVKNITAERLVQVLETVAEGALWLDPAIAHMAFTVLSSPVKPEGFQPGASSLSQALNEREQTILQLLVQGKTNADIAKELYISVHTAKFYVSSLMEKLAVTDRVQAAVKAVKEGLV